MGALLSLLAIAAGIGSLVCFIMVVIQMFQHGQTGLGIVCALLFWCIGPLIAFIYGWIKAGEWNIQNIMIAWTACIVIAILVQVVLIGSGAGGGAFVPQAG